MCVCFLRFYTGTSSSATLLKSTWRGDGVFSTFQFQTNGLYLHAVYFIYLKRVANLTWSI